MRLHFENNTFVLSRSRRARPFAWHLETLVWFWFYVVVTKKRFGAAHTMEINLSKVAQCSEVALFEKTFVISFKIKSMMYLRRFRLTFADKRIF